MIQAGNLDKGAKGIFKTLNLDPKQIGINSECHKQRGTSFTNTNGVVRKIQDDLPQSCLLL